MTDSDKWITPPDLLAQLDKEFHFTRVGGAMFDPCPITWKVGDPDGLIVDWAPRTFVNPPFSNVALWIKKASEEYKNGKLVVMLINAVTGTNAFHEYIYPEFKKPDGKIELRFFKGRLRLINPAKPDERKASPHDSMLVIFKP